MSRLWAISDLHLSFSSLKPMDIFGIEWENHAERIKELWIQKIICEDTVAICGDLSWAMKWENAIADLQWISALPGQKVIVKGNHDYWWMSIKKMKSTFPFLHFVHNNAITIGKTVFAGTRLWDFPECSWPFSQIDIPKRNTEEKPSNDKVNIREADPEKIRARELDRLTLSLSQLPKEDNVLKVCLTHFPPIGSEGKETELTQVIASYGVRICLFGHIHRKIQDWRNEVLVGMDANVNGMRCVLTTPDALDFAPKLICEMI